MRNTLALIAGILAFIDVFPYVIDVIHGKTKPHVVSWLTWTLLLIIATAAAFDAHQTKTALLTLGDTLGTTLVLILGLKYGIAKYTWFDGVCQVVAIMGLILWLVFNSPAIAIVAAVVVDFVGSIPTLRHSWTSPQEETWQAYGITVFASALTLGSLTRLSVTSFTFPIYLLLANLLIVIVVVYRRNKLGLGLSRKVGINESIR